MVSRDDLRRLPPPDRNAAPIEPITYPAVRCGYVDIIYWWARSYDGRLIPCAGTLLYDLALRSGRPMIAHLLVGLLGIPPSSRTFERKAMLERPSRYPRATLEDMLPEAASHSDLTALTNRPESDDLLALFPLATSYTRLEVMDTLIQSHRFSHFDQVWERFPKIHDAYVDHLSIRPAVAEIILARHRPSDPTESVTARVRASNDAMLAAKKLARRRRDNARRIEKRRWQKEEAARRVAQEQLAEARAREAGSIVRS